MKTLLALLVSICSAHAVFLDVHHDTQKKLDFTLDWHQIFPFEGKYLSPITDISVDWQPYGAGDDVLPDFVQVDIYISSPLFHDPPLAFTRRAQIDLLYQPWPDTFLGIQQTQQVGGKIAKDQMSARLTFFEKDYLPVQVPDTGSTLGMLAFALAGFPFLRRREI
jgi:hypothetical protein